MLTLILSQALELSSTPRPEIEVYAHIMTTDWPQLIISCCSIVIAIISIVFTSLSYRAQREYNKTVFRSSLDIVVDDYSNCFKVCLRNSGLGPAILKSFSIEKDEKSYDSIQKFYDSFENTLRGDDNVVLSANMTFHEGEVLSLGTSITLFGIEEKNYTNKTAFKNHLNLIKNQFRGATVTVRFQNLGDDRDQEPSVKTIQ